MTKASKPVRVNISQTVLRQEGVNSDVIRRLLREGGIDPGKQKSRWEDKDNRCVVFEQNYEDSLLAGSENAECHGEAGDVAERD